MKLEIKKKKTKQNKNATVKKKHFEQIFMLSIKPRKCAELSSQAQLKVSTNIAIKISKKYISQKYHFAERE